MPTKSHSFLISLLAVVIVVALGVGAYFFFGSHPSMPPAAAPSTGATTTTTTTTTASGTTASTTATAAPLQVITSADAGKTITLSKNTPFVVQLGTGFTWAVSFKPTGIVSLIPGPATPSSIQGVYAAVAAGTATLQATGTPVCVTGQTCSTTPTSITVTVKVQ